MSEPIDPLDEPELHREDLEHAEAFLTERGIHGQYEVLLGDPASSIVNLAEKQGADLIVVGTRERGFLERLIGAQRERRRRAPSALRRADRPLRSADQERQSGLLRGFRSGAADSGGFGLWPLARQ